MGPGLARARKDVMQACDPTGAAYWEQRPEGNTWPLRRTA